MTDKEKAVVMAYTGACMLTGDKFRIFHEYIEEIMGGPIMTHEIGILSKEIKEKAKADFIALCEDEHSSEKESKTDIRECGACKYSKDGHRAGIEECHECMWVSQYKPKTEWILASEKLPNDREWYLGIFKEPDTGWINSLPFVCDYVGHETKATTKEYWILRGFTDRDEHIDYYFNLECVAWQPLPEAYKAESEG